MGTGGFRYPLLLSMSGRLALVIGEDAGTERLVRTLASHGASVRVVAPAPSPALAALEGEGVVTLVRRGYVRGDLAGATLAFAVGQPSEIGVAMASEAAERGCLLNLSEDPASSDFEPAEGAATEGEAR